MTTEEYVALRHGDIVELHHMQGTKGPIRKVLVISHPGMDSITVLFSGERYPTVLPRVTVRDHGFCIGRWDNTI